MNSLEERFGRWAVIPEAETFFFLSPMRFTIVINQVKVQEWGLNLVEAAIFSYCYELPSWAESLHVNGHCYYYSAKNKIIEELPCITDKPDTVLRILKTLKDKGLIVTFSTNNKGYIRLTEKGKTWNYKGTEKNPEGYGKKSVPGTEKNPGNNSTNDKYTMMSGANAPESGPERIKYFKCQFFQTLIEFVKEHDGKYPKLMYVAFVRYWIERSPGGKKLRYQGQRFFDMERRLITWFTKSDDKELTDMWQKENKLESLNKLLFDLL